MMFTQNDFELPLETSLKLRVMTDEINNCNDTENLKKHLKEVTTMLVRYQHILNNLLKKQLESETQRLLGFHENDKIEQDT